MAKYYEDTSIYNYHWDQVLIGFWRRYPNPFSTHVLSEDTIKREVKGGKLYSTRLLTKTNKVPRWGEFLFVKGHFVCIVEESVVDPKTKTLTTYTRNIGFNRIMSVVEKVIYRASHDHPGKTLAFRSAWIDSQVYGFATAIKAFGHDRFKKNCKKTLAGFNYIMEHLFPKPLASRNEIVHNKLKDAALAAKDHVQEQIYQVYSVQN